MLAIGPSNANTNRDPSYFTIQDIEYPEIEECIEALSKGFMFKEDIYSEYNQYQVLYEDSVYSLTLNKDARSGYLFGCFRSIYKERKK